MPGRRERPRATIVAVVLVLLGACAWWVIAPPIPEGPVLLRLSADHGFDASDLLILPALALVVWLLWPKRVRDYSSH